MDELGLKEEKHFKPYKIQWFSKGEEAPVKTRRLYPFLICKHHQNDSWHDVAYILLGRPWLYDDGVLLGTWDKAIRVNTYTFHKHSINVMLCP